MHEPRARQRGQAVLALLVLLGIALSVFVYNMVDPTHAAVRREARTQAVLVEAKEALIGRAAADANRPGSLPCPDTDGDGIAELFAGSDCPSYLGLLPWRTLGLPDLRDDSGERLWYALSDTFRDNAAAGALNSDTKGNRTVHSGTTTITMTAEGVAVVFAPGASLGSQNRDPGVSALCPTTGTTIARNLCATNFLEAAGGANNASPIGPFVLAQGSDSFNDKLLVITTAELIPVVERRVGLEVRRALQDYKGNTACACTNLGGTAGCYPYADLSNGFSDADPFNPGEGNNRGRIPALGAAPSDWGSSPCGDVLTLPAWFVNNDWRLVIYYSAGRNFLGPNAPTGCSTCVDSTLTVNGVAGREVVIFTPGPLVGAAPRAPVPLNDPTYWQYYLQDSANSDLNDVYVTPASAAYTRNRIYSIP